MQTKTVEALIKAGADLNIRSNNGWTALMWACRYSNTDSKQKTIEALIKAGADVNIKDNDGWTALMLSCEISDCNKNGKQETIEALIKAGADLDIRSKNGLTALMLAYRSVNEKSKQGTIGALIKAEAGLCYADIYCFSSQYIDEIIIDRHQHNPVKIEPLLNHISPELKDKYEYYRQCITNIKPIIECHTEIYYQPYNIGALLCQANFESKQNVKYCPHKLLFLFAKN